MIASDKVGCGCIALATSYAVPSNSIVITASEIISVALGARICTPMISPYFLPAIILIKPSVSPSARAFPLPAKGNLLIR
jgi:hypothetical protein